MSDGAIDEIIGQAGFAQVDLLDAKFDELNKKFVESAKNLVAINVALGNNKSVKDYIKSMQDMNKELGVINKQRIEADILEQKRINLELRNQKLREGGVKKELDAWGELIQKHKDAERAAQNMAVTMGKGSQKFQEAATASNKLLNEIKAIEFTLGNARRNVGNYGQAVFSLSQVLREMPAFAYDAKMGILAIGNNLPILADNFIKVKNDTGSAMSAIGIFAKSLFSFTNIFTIAIGLFTVFYEQIMNFIRGTNTAKDAIDKMNKSLSGGDYAKASEDLMKLRNSINLVKEGKLSANDALILYNNTIGETIGKVKTWEEAEDSILKKGNLWLEYMKLKTQASALYGQAAMFAAEIEATKGEEPGTMKNTLAYIKGSYLLFSNWGKSLDELNKKKREYLDESNQDDINALENKKSIYEQKAAEIEASMLKIAKQIGIITPSTITKGGKSSDGKNEINREQELEEEYKKELLVAKQYQELNVENEVTYREKILSIISKFVKRKAALESGKLSENESNTATSFGATLLGDTTASKSAIEKYYDDIAKNLYNHDENIWKHEKQLAEEKQKSIKAIQALENELAEQEQRHINELIKKKKDELELNEQKKSAKTNLIFAGISAGLDISSTLVDRKYTLEIQAIEARDKALSESYNNELRFIEQSGLSQVEKEKRKQKLEAETEAKRKKIDKDRADAAKRQAKLQKAISVSTIIAQTAQAVMVAWGDPTTPADNAFQALIAGLEGAAQLVKVLATPLPQYAKGRKGGPSEYAVVSELGQEAMRTTDGKISLLPKTKSIVHLPQGADVIPHHELIKNAAYVHLASQGGTITTDRLQRAMINKFDELIDENRALKQVLISKSFAVNDSSGYEAWKNSKIK